jgi:hypothetical protein
MQRKGVEKMSEKMVKFGSSKLKKRIRKIRENKLVVVLSEKELK